MKTLIKKAIQPNKKLTLRTKPNKDLISNYSKQLFKKKNDY